MGQITKGNDMDTTTIQRIVRIETKLSKAFEAMGIDVGTSPTAAIRSMRIMEGDDGKDFIEVSHLDISLLVLQKFCAFEGIDGPIRIEFQDHTVGTFHPRPAAQGV